MALRKGCRMAAAHRRSPREIDQHPRSARRDIFLHFRSSSDTCISHPLCWPIEPPLCISVKRTQNTRTSRHAHALHVTQTRRSNPCDPPSRVESSSARPSLIPPHAQAHPHQSKLACTPRGLCHPRGNMPGYQRPPDPQRAVGGASSAAQSRGCGPRPMRTRAPVLARAPNPAPTGCASGAARPAVRASASSLSV